MKLRNTPILFILVFSIGTLVAQDTDEETHTVSINVTEIALLDLESQTGTAISLNGTAPTEAGNKVAFNASNHNIWINYSSICSSGNGNQNTREITVQITDGDVPDGLELKVVATEVAGLGDGAMGDAEENALVLSTQNAQTIIDDIGNAYTGNGPSKGHNLTYTLTKNSDADSYASLNFNQSQTITITYTLSDN
ncbi:MAG: hypothetical protein COB81_03325 [Flavobacteriaceae bacterium]|nr:MAG: hypothetical protein COB81_03325 [Flavobacteriaceae bacterium]